MSAETKNKAMKSYLLDFREIDKNQIAAVGGKGANLGELSKINGIRVPEGFCITTEAYLEIIRKNQALHSLLDEMTKLKASDRKEISKISTQIRKLIEETAIPKKIDLEIIRHLEQFSEETAFAIRSSATAEDLPTASFAGQQDTYLNITGTNEIRKHISKCWASLFTERAIIYRIQNGFEHQKVQLSVVVQKMIFPQAAGILFTADPLTSNRTVLSIDASFGLGEALVSGLVNADNYQVCDGKISDKKISSKKKEISPLEGGGTKEKEIEPGKQNEQTLTDEQILQLASIGRKIEAHFGSPQDIEWCLSDEHFYFVQSRPITTLFPIPEANDQEKHVYASVGHQQMMTDAMKPLGLSIWQLSTSHPMHIAGGRLFIAISKQLATARGRETLLNTLGKSDPLSRDALLSIIEREYVPQTSEDPNSENPANIKHFATREQVKPDPSLVTELIQQNLESIKELKKEIQSKSGIDLMDFIAEDLQVLKKLLFDPKSFSVLMAGINASAWINEKLFDWLGEKNAADTLSQSLDHNVTSEMGLALLDVADVIRSYPEVTTFLQEVKDGDFLEKLTKLKGGREAQEVMMGFLEKYGMRCVGEIDLTKTRWIEKPGVLIPLIINHIKNFEPGESKRKFEQGRAEALAKEQELLKRLKQLPDGEQKARETKEQIDRIRNFSGYREFPKYIMVSRYFIYKQAIMKEAEKLVLAGVIAEKEDIFYLTFGELQKVLQTKQADQQLLEKRKEEFKTHEKLSPPRFITSEGEIISGKYKREDLPVNAHAGLAVSSGLIEGRARVILNLEDAVIEEGDILVTKFTDPSWTPLFVSIKGLVTEVGGIMTHGAVIAREYGIPAVVGLEDATKLIKDGERIRVNGTDGFVEII